MVEDKEDEDEEEDDDDEEDEDAIAAVAGCNRTGPAAMFCVQKGGMERERFK